jgi:hypothetical protein
MLSAKAQVFAIAVSAGILLVVLELVRRRRLGERYALLWLATGVVLLVLSAWTGLLNDVADLLGIKNSANALFAIAFGFVLLLLLHFSITVSRLAEQNKVLAQEAARLDQELRSRPASAAAAPGSGSGDGSEERERAPSSASTADQ